MILYNENENEEDEDETEDDSDESTNGNDDVIEETKQSVNYYDLTFSSTVGVVIQPFEGARTYPAGILVGVIPAADEGYVFTGYSGDVDKKMGNE